jgi:hypothetical protein
MTTGKNGPTMSKVGKTEANCGENAADGNSELGFEFGLAARPPI